MNESIRYLSDFEEYGGTISLLETLKINNKFVDKKVVFHINEEDYTVDEPVYGTVRFYWDGTAVIQSVYDEINFPFINGSPVERFMRKKREIFIDEYLDADLHQKYMHKQNLISSKTWLTCACYVIMLASFLLAIEYDVFSAVLLFCLGSVGALLVNSLHTPRILSLNTQYFLEEEDI